MQWLACAVRLAVGLGAQRVVYLYAGAMAQSAELLNTLPAPGALTTAIYFPEHPTKQFPAGDIVSAVPGGREQGLLAFRGAR